MNNPRLSPVPECVRSSLLASDAAKAVLLQSCAGMVAVRDRRQMRLPPPGPSPEAPQVELMLPGER